MDAPTETPAEVALRHFPDSSWVAVIDCDSTSADTLLDHVPLLTVVVP